MEHTIIYEDENGIRLLLTVPWGHHSGQIPPPIIKFWTRFGEQEFLYAGSKDD